MIYRIQSEKLFSSFPHKYKYKSLLLSAPEKKSKLKESKGKKRAKLEEDDGGMMEDENCFETNSVSDMMGGPHDHMGEKDGEEDHSKVVRESERRHANNARERFVDITNTFFIS